MKTTILAIALIVAGAAVAQDASNSAPAKPKTGFDRYRVIVERNIFSRQRTPGTVGSRSNGEAGINGEQTQTKKTEPTPSPPPEPGAQVVLIGVSFVGDYATAVFEDRRDGSIYAAQVGEKLIDRTIQSITLDTVEVDHEGRRVQVVIGRTLAGTDAPAPAAASETSDTATTGTPGATTPTDPATQSILERLRARREEQLKK